MSQSCELTHATTAKARQPAQQWVRFWHLTAEERFYVGRLTAKKTGCLTATVFPVEGPKSIRVWPWTKVRSARPVKKPASESKATS